MKRLWIEQFRRDAVLSFRRPLRLFYQDAPCLDWLAVEYALHTNAAGPLEDQCTTASPQLPALGAARRSWLDIAFFANIAPGFATVHTALHLATA